MPGWHEKTKSLQDAGTIRMVGIVQEQHPDRAALFMQWKQMAWPVLVDPLNQLGVAVVPITLFIDELGVVRGGSLFRRDGMSYDDFVAAPPVRAGTISSARGRPSIERLRRSAEHGAPEAQKALGDALVLWGGGTGPGQAVEAYGAALEQTPDDGEALFRRGVAYLMRHDSDASRPGDFARAVEHWAAARATNPNQYIWRRRIQQYGPRLDKPYPFYDWVTQARADITARGETPVPIRVEPGGAEFAQPMRRFATVGDAPAEPDPSGRVTRDDKYIALEAIEVAHTDKAGSARVHVLFRPNANAKAHWNNEAEPLGVWVSPPEGWQVDSPWQTLINPPRAVSDEVRRVEFEINGPATGSVRIPGYALYNVCEGADGTCLYRRQDFVVEISLDASER